MQPDFFTWFYCVFFCCVSLIKEKISLLNKEVDQKKKKKTPFGSFLFFLTDFDWNISFHFSVCVCVGSFFSRAQTHTHPHTHTHTHTLKHTHTHIRRLINIIIVISCRPSSCRVFVSLTANHLVVVALFIFFGFFSVFFGFGTSFNTVV